ncbi:hypothetical protein B0I35DRAFT_418756 [Stachybotrys elegans]|uniref:Secreted protein n=1 Tax=Stachybotrys elegans TaxID=80388 RepID=A0A8K0T7S5_9HYPO|nr:hypothetical protein B0I35DRAFT_418756 [Stachybotrys elegans]
MSQMSSFFPLCPWLRVAFGFACLPSFTLLSADSGRGHRANVAIAEQPSLRHMPKAKVSFRLSQPLRLDYASRQTSYCVVPSV